MMHQVLQRVTWPLFHGPTILLASSVLVGCGGGNDGATTTPTPTPYKTERPQSLPSVPPATGGGSDGATKSNNDRPVEPDPKYSRKVNWNRTEAPVNWDFKAVYPSRAACGALEGKIFEVGAGKPYGELKDVPWLSLVPCDIVRIYYRPEPYRDIVFIGSRGEKDKWITIQGMPGPNGERPVLDGANAVMPVGTGATKWTDAAALMMIQSPDANVVSNRALKYHPGYLHITGLKFQNAHMANNVIPLSGVMRRWEKFSSGIQITGGEQVAVSYCEFTQNGNGLFVNSTNEDQLQSRNILVAHNHFYQNGVVNSASEHNAYTEAIGIVYEYNYFDSPVTGTGGLNIKERSPGTVFRYNYVRNGTMLLGLMDPDSNHEYERYNAVDKWGVDMNSMAFIYSNIFIVDQPTIYDQTAPTIVEYGAGGSVTAWNPHIRYGTVYFYNNRVISKLNSIKVWIKDSSGTGIQVEDSVPLFTLANTRIPAAVDARMNVFYATNATDTVSTIKPRQFSLFGLQGIPQNWADNWISSYRNSQAIVADGGYNMGLAYTGNVGLGGLQAEVASSEFAAAVKSGDYWLPNSSPALKFNSTYAQAISDRNLLPAGTPPLSPPRATLFKP